MSEEIAVKGWIKLSKAKAYLETWSNTNGEVLSKLQIMRCLALGNAIASEEVVFDRRQYLPKGQKFIGSNHLSEFFDDYLKLLSILSGNQFIKIVHDCSAHRARVFQIGEEFLGGSTMFMSNWEYDQFNAVYEKRRRAGAECSTSRPVCIDIDRKTLDKILPPHLQQKNSKHTPESLWAEVDRQWSVIKDINVSGSIKPQRKRKSRGHSLLTGLSKPLDGYIRIDGDPAVSLDQHATYFTLLPRIIEHCDPIFKNNGFHQEMNRLDAFIRDSENIYANIGETISRPIQDVKLMMNPYICNPIKKLVDWKELDSWMFLEYWNIRDALRSMRPNNRISKYAMEIESGIFLGASKILNAQGVPALTKHDALIFLPKDMEIAESVLKGQFDAARVCYKCKLSKSSLESERTENSKEKERGGEQENMQQQKNKSDNRLASTVQTFISLSVQRSKLSQITCLSDGRFRISIKGKSVNSRSGESLHDFRLRISREYPEAILRD
jgi:hypothetical protein